MIHITQMIKTSSYLIKASGVALIVFYILLAGWRYSVDGLIQLTFWLSVAAATSWACAVINKPKRYWPILPRHSWAYLLLIGSGLISSFQSINTQLSILDMQLWAVNLFLFLLVINLIHHKVFTSLELANGFMIAGLLYNTAKIFQVVNIWLGNGIRSDGRIYLPNKTAAFVNILIVLAVTLILGQKKRGGNMLAWVTLTSSLFILWYTGSRGGTIAGMVGIALVLYISSVADPQLFKRPILTAAVDIVGSAAFVLSSTSHRVGQISGSLSILSISSGRLVIWEAALDLFRLHPVFGSGPNTFYYYAITSLNQIHHKFIHTHNIYLQILSERGLVGIVIAVVFLLVILISLLLEPGSFVFKTAGLAIITTYLIQGLVDLPFTEPIIMRSMVVLLGLGLSPDYCPNCQNDE